MTDVIMTPDGGNYRRAIAFHYGFIVVAFIPVLVVVVLAIINPFWFRDSFFNWIETRVHKLARWRDYHKYALYLGTDPKMWHALKDSNESH